MERCSTFRRVERIGAKPIFVDELERFAADVRDPRCAAIAERLATPLRVAVSGRPGVGRSTAARALVRVGDLRGTIALTSQPSDADLHVYLFPEVVKPEDRAAIAATDRPVLTVLTKADLIATTETGRHPQGPTIAADQRCLQLSARTGLSIEPLAGILAVAALEDLVDDTAWAGLQELAAGDPVAAPVRRRLLDILDVFGIAQAIAAIRLGATRAEAVTLLRRLSRIDDVADAIERLGAQVRYQRVLDAVADLEMLAVTDPRISEFLSRDDTVVARMLAAVDVVEAAGITVDRGDTADQHLRRALDWRHARPVADVHRVCSADIVRGSLRLWAGAGGAA
jgi:hypothetical protein